MMTDELDQMQRLTNSAGARPRFRPSTTAPNRSGCIAWKYSFDRGPAEQGYSGRMVPGVPA